MPMLIKGDMLKDLIHEGLERHQKYLTLTMSVTLQDFADFLDRKNNYDFFSLLAQLTLKVDKDTGPLIANLMKVTDLELDVTDPHTFSNLGFFFSDFIRRDECLRYFRSKNRKGSKLPSNDTPKRT